jgi:alpha/beta superfamily hydrolase
MANVILNGPAGRLEGKYVAGDPEKEATALFLPPSPLQGGTMNNRIIYTLYHLFNQKGFSCLRINFRGVGRSEGNLNKNEGHLEDSTSALDWLQKNHSRNKHLWVIGFSFGSWISMQLLMRRPEIKHFVVVSPQTDRLDFGFLIPCPAPGIIIHGEKDRMTPEKNVTAFAEKLNAQKKNSIHYTVIPEANHNYSGMSELVSEEVSNYVDSQFEE